MHVHLFGVKHFQVVYLIVLFFSSQLLLFIQSQSMFLVVKVLLLVYECFGALLWLVRR